MINVQTVIYYYHLVYVLRNINIRIVFINKFSFSKLQIRISMWITVFFVEYKRFKHYFNSFLFICFTCFILYNKFKYRNLIELKSIKKYVRDCKKSINYNLNKIS